jgi:hypothetical protein
LLRVRRRGDDSDDRGDPSSPECQLSHGVSLQSRVGRASSTCRCEHYTGPDLLTTLKNDLD